MKTYIVKRKKDGMYLNISETEIINVLNRETWNGSGFVKDFELIGEEKNNDEEMAKLFDE